MKQNVIDKVVNEVFIDYHITFMKENLEKYYRKEVDLVYDKEKKMLNIVLPKNNKKVKLPLSVRTILQEVYVLSLYDFSIIEDGKKIA